MKLSVSHDGQEWQFELIETGGSALPTKIRDTSLQFESYLIVAVTTGMMSIPVLYNLLNTLVQNSFHGFIVAITDDIAKPKLRTWEVRKSTGDDKGDYICKVGYKVFMPQTKLDYQYTMESK
jgi:hypothetical protein